MIVDGFAGDHPDLEDQILELHNTVFYRNKKKSFKALCGIYEAAYWFLWLDGQRVVSMATIGYNEPRKAWHVFNVATHPDYRNRKIMREIYKAIKLHVGKRALLFGLVHKKNRIAAKIYRKLGAKYNEGDKYNEWFMCV